MMKKLVFLLLLFSLSFSAETCNDLFTDFFHSTWAEASMYLGVVILFTVSIISLAYIYGSSVNDPKALVFSKDELFHLLVSVLIIIGAVGLITFSCHVGNFFLDFTFDSLQITDNCHVNKATPETKAICFLKRMEDDTKDMVAKTIDSSVYYEMESTWVMTNNFPLLGTTTTPLSSHLKTYGTNHDLMNTLFATPALISITMQRLILESSLKFSIIALLPFAILLRVFFPTRQMGNILIALVIGVQVFLPMMYALNGAMYVYIFTDDDCTSNPAYSAIIQDHVFGSCTSSVSLLKFARLIPQAIFLPNLTIAIFITFLAAVNKALRVIG